MDAKILLDSKRTGAELQRADIREFVCEFMRGNVRDYQMAAFLMAVCCRGMSQSETAALTDALRKSGAELEWNHLAIPTADKHSTGGVGDKISLVCLPLAASCGVAVPSLMGRGLGLTGGTVDKLEAIPHFNATLDAEALRKVVGACGLAMSAVSSDIAPADGLLYALRDVTGTVASVPLVTASILSKKLAEGAQTLVFDVKCGSGAFMKHLEDARELAQSLVDGAKAAGRKAVALVTDMDEPLGRAVGNANEVKEALDVLGGATDPCDVADLGVELAARMVALAKEIPLDDARNTCRDNLNNGKALDAFRRMVAAQGGDIAALPDFTANAQLRAEQDGFVQRIDANKIAIASLAAGALRQTKESAIDLRAGVFLKAKRGDRVAKGDVLAEISASGDAQAVARLVAQAYAIGDTPPAKKNMVLEVVQ